MLRPTRSAVNDDISYIEGIWYISVIDFPVALYQIVFLRRISGFLAGPIMSVIRENYRALVCRRHITVQFSYLVRRGYLAFVVILIALKTYPLNLKNATPRYIEIVAISNHFLSALDLRLCI